jgi:protein-disulfide isomerase
MSAASRRTQLIVIGAFAAIIVVVLVAISAGGGDDTDEGDAASNGAEAASLFNGIAQSGTTLGDPDAPATLTEFADLQCPFCAEFARGVLPTLVDEYVRPGELALDFQALTFIGEDSLEAAQMAAAAGLQDRLWNFVDGFYANQGTENSGYVDDEFLTEVAGSIDGLDVDRALDDRDSPEVQTQLDHAEDEAAAFGIESTPSFLLAVSDDEPRLLELASLDPDDFTAALDEALSAGQ